MQAQNIFDDKDISANSESLAILKRNFPKCFDKSGKFDIETLSQILGVENIKKEGFELKFLGKSYARLTANLNPKTLLMPDIDHNSKNENAQNLLIKGDNLEVLKHLKNAYFESIKMIYIDPPYNTGSDGFVYKDDRKFNVDELSSLAGISQEEAKRVLEFTAKGSNSHSAWLSFIYPRLYIARELLRDDGVIFISIDDNEQAQLKILCDEIFGEENFVGILIWKKTENIKMDSKYFSENKDYVLCYKKYNLSYFNKILSDHSRYKFEDEKGKYYLRKLDSKSSSYSRSMDYVIENGGKKYYAGGSFEKWQNRQSGANKKDCIWLWSKEKFEQGLLENEIVFAKGNVYNKVRYDGVAKKPYTDFLDVSSGQSSQTELDRLFDNNRVFDHPKPVDLVCELIKMVTNSSNNDIILDFFAGSGTTAHAVMAQNLEDGGNRKFILVQLDEKIDEKKSKTAYDFCKNELKSKNPTIFDITKERILRAAQSLSLSLSLKTMRGLNLKSFRLFHF